MAPALSDAQREAVEARLDSERVNEQLRMNIGAGFQMAINQRMRGILSELDDRGVGTNRANVDVSRIAAEYAVKSLLNSDSVLARSNSGPETAEIAVGGQADGEVRTNTTVMDTETDGPETYTVEVPIEGGENPETVEVERVEPPTDPRLNSDLSPMETERAFREGLTPNGAKKGPRTNDSDASDEETDPEDVPTGGLPWYQ